MVKTAIVKTEAKNEVGLFIQQAIEKGLPVEVMEKLFALHLQVKADKSREVFVTALANFQSQVPVISKTKKVLNKDGSLRYQYAPLDTIIEQIKKPLADNGLSFSWTVENREGFIKATAKITHSFGHFETSTFEIPIDKEGYMTAPQKYASALTFAKRYALCNALGISTAEEDTDATDVNKEKTAKSVKARIVFLLRQLKEKADTKEQIVEGVKRLVQLSLEDKNYGEIVERLEIIVSERQNENPKIS